MTSNLAPTAGRAVPGGALFALAIGLLLYVTTSLVLGSSAGSRVFDVSLSLPRIEAAPEGQANLLGDPITGSRLMAAAGLARLRQAPPIAVSARVAQKAIRATGPAATSAPVAKKTQALPGRTSAVRSKRTHYHDADERSHRLARRR